MIAIIDYDMGNLLSVQKAFEKLGQEAVITRDSSKIKDASHVVLPGVGAFKDCMANLEKFSLVDTIKDTCASGKPFLGICLGLQLLFDKGFEQGEHVGLGIIKGSVVRFPAPHHEDVSEFKVPHMGWNTVVKSKESPLLNGIEDNEYFYFVHSYYASPEDKSVVLTTTGYGVEFASSIEKDNIMACQFHPEKSQKMGLRLLQNFIGV